MRAMALGNLLNFRFYSPHHPCLRGPHLLLGPECPGVSTRFGGTWSGQLPGGRGKEGWHATRQVCVQAFAMVISFGPQYPGRGGLIIPILEMGKLRLRIGSGLAQVLQLN